MTIKRTDTTVPVDHGSAARESVTDHQHVAVELRGNVRPAGFALNFTDDAQLPEGAHLRPMESTGYPNNCAGWTAAAMQAALGGHGGTDVSAALERALAGIRATKARDTSKLTLVITDADLGVREHPVSELGGEAKADDAIRMTRNMGAAFVELGTPSDAVRIDVHAGTTHEDILAASDRAKAKRGA